MFGSESSLKIIFFTFLVSPQPLYYRTLNMILLDISFMVSIHANIDSGKQETVVNRKQWKKGNSGNQETVVNRKQWKKGNIGNQEKVVNTGNSVKQETVVNRKQW